MKLFTSTKKVQVGSQLKLGRFLTFLALLLFTISTNAQTPREADPHTIVSNHGDFVKAIPMMEDDINYRLNYVMADIPKDGAKSKTPSYKVKSEYAVEGMPLSGDQRYFNSVAPTATFVVNYNGFTPEAQAAFQYAVDIWSRSLVSNVPIVINANFGNLGPGVLGGASAAFSVSSSAPGTFPLTNIFYPSALADKLLGQDVSPILGGSAGDPDIITSFNSTIGFGFDWYYGTDANPGPNEFDFVTVVLHEIGHGLGMSSTGPDFFCDFVLAESGYGLFNGSEFLPNIYDTFLEDVNGTKLTDFDANFCYPDGSVVANIMKEEGYLNGPNLLLGNLERARIYTPNPVQFGSSVSHFDETAFPTGENRSLMTPFLAPQEAIHVPGTNTLGLFADLGWMISESFAIPTMGQWALMILGLAMSSLGLVFMYNKSRKLA